MTTLFDRMADHSRQLAALFAQGGHQLTMAILGSEDEALSREALAWAMGRGSRSGRVAWQ